MSSLPIARWSVSFADLGLLLLGCFVMLHAMESARPKAAAPASTAATPRSRAFDAASLFQPGEAVLLEPARARLKAEGRRLAGRSIAIVSRGAGEGGGRLDRFELSAARAAAVGRALQEGGADRRSIAISASSDGMPGQQITIVAH